jgi:hypothetical protein
MTHRADLYSCFDARVSRADLHTTPLQTLTLHRGLKCGRTRFGQGRKIGEMSKLRFLHEFITPFTEAFGCPPEPPPCFYLEGHPLLEEPCQISTPDLGNVCLLTGIPFHVDDDLGCQMFIEDRTGLIAAVRAAQAATMRNSGKANLQAITRWRRCCADNMSIGPV